MDDPLFVRRFDRDGDLLRDGQRLGQRNGASIEPRRQRRAFDKLHDEGVRRAGVLEPIHVCDVGMVERAEHLRFAMESREPIGIGGEGVWQDFQRDISGELAVTGPIHLAHAAPADDLDNLVGSDPGSWRQRHCGSEVILRLIPRLRATALAALAASVGKPTDITDPPARSQDRPQFHPREALVEPLIRS